MGCCHSKIEREETVSRCKARKRYMKQFVQARHAFSAAHVMYIRSLRATGSALFQFANAETTVHSSPTTHINFVMQTLSLAHTWRLYLKYPLLIPFTLPLKWCTQLSTFTFSPSFVWQLLHQAFLKIITKIIKIWWEINRSRGDMAAWRCRSSWRFTSNDLLVKVIPNEKSSPSFFLSIVTIFKSLSKWFPRLE